MLLASEVLDRARQILHDQDASGYRWSNAALLRWLEDAETIVTILQPGANSVRRTITLTPGESWHALGTDNADVIRILEVERNIDEADNPGPVITLVDSKDVSRLDRDQARSSPGLPVRNYAIRRTDPRRFFTDPRVPTTPVAKVEVLVSVMPAALDSVEDELDLARWYRPILADLVAAKALMEDTPGSDYPRGEKLFATAMQMLSGTTQPGEADTHGDIKPNA